ncbi:hypothetical protein SGGMMB4_03995 [Sodalis glossinidius str. 'morsitans']|uniref:Uncharacterized protein n=1 Tax=Sodalis glossinidius (strain morsitans) TaxID=343509 RepID=A0A193QL22_SODGM|nr:hypothetical protein SGGMMB4_03995 [Sodalis glossinidius str. 'morsitans']
MNTELSSYRRQIGCNHNRQLQPGSVNRNPAARNDANNSRTSPLRCMSLLIIVLLLISQIAQALAAPPAVARGQHGPPSRGAHRQTDMCSAFPERKFRARGACLGRGTHARATRISQPVRPG